MTMAPVTPSCLVLTKHPHALTIGQSATDDLYREGATSKFLAVQDHDTRVARRSIQDLRQSLGEDRRIWIAAHGHIHAASAIYRPGRVFAASKSCDKSQRAVEEILQHLSRIELGFRQRAGGTTMMVVALDDVAHGTGRFSRRAERQESVA
jgi:hypothetical protein